MNYSVTDRLTDHITLLQQVEARMKKANESHETAIEPNILHQLGLVIEQLLQQSDSAYDDGRDWLMNILTHHPQLTPVIDRDLLWFFGGECLHFMEDQEIELFQQLDEVEAEHQAEQKSFDRAAIKTLLKQNHQSFNA